LWLPSASQLGRLRENLKAADLQLPPQTVAELNTIAANAARRSSERHH
jgi:pyridoxine 4-dehydrogenase